MKTLRWLSVVLVLALTLALVGGVAANGGIEGVNSFTFTPNPVWAGSSALVSVNVGMGPASIPGPVRFCYYVPDTLVGAGLTSPAPWTLKYASGFTFVNETFNRSDGTGTCPDVPGMISYLYTSVNNFSGPRTFSGSYTWTIPNNQALKGNYMMTFLPEAPSSGGAEFADVSFSIYGPSAVSLKSVSARSFLPVGLLLVTVVLGAGVLVLRRRA